MSILNDLFGSGGAKANEIRNRNSREGAALLRPEAISRTARGLLRARGTEIQGAVDAAQVGAEAASTRMSANLAMQGLGGTGLGASFAGAARAGAAFQGNQLRAALTSEIFGQALQANAAAGNMLASTFIEAEPAAFGTALQAVGGLGVGLGALGNLRKK